MPRAANGQVLVLKRRRGTVYALRFRALGRRQYLTLGSSRDGWTFTKAEEELANVLADVRRGLWQPPMREEPAPAISQAPTFHEFASEWVEARRLEVKARTTEEDEWALTLHLLPYFARYRVDQITPELVDRYRTGKVRERNALEIAHARGERRAERTLSNDSINKTIRKLAQVLEVAVEYGHIERNPARGKRRLLKAARPQRTYLDCARHIIAVLEAGTELDEAARAGDPRQRRPILMVLIFAGPRIGELLALRWRDIDLAGGRIRVPDSKTDAGIRDLDLLPVLRDELAAYKARLKSAEPNELVFGTRTGRQNYRSNVEGRVVRKAAERASERLLACGEPPMPDRITPHSLRRTFASVLYALGESPVDVMNQMGHEDPKLALAIYAKSMRRDEKERTLLRELVEGVMLSTDGPVPHDSSWMIETGEEGR